MNIYLHVNRLKSAIVILLILSSVPSSVSNRTSKKTLRSIITKLENNENLPFFGLFHEEKIQFDSHIEVRNSEFFHIFYPIFHFDNQSNQSEDSNHNEEPEGKENFHIRITTRQNDKFYSSSIFDDFIKKFENEKKSSSLIGLNSIYFYKSSNVYVYELKNFDRSQYDYRVVYDSSSNGKFQLVVLYISNKKDKNNEILLVFNFDTKKERHVKEYKKLVDWLKGRDF